MQYRPFWWSLFHPDLNGGLIVIAIFLLLVSLANLVGFLNTLGEPNAMLSLVPVFMYGVPGFGLLRLKKWARLFEIVYSIFLVVLGFIVMFFAHPGMGLAMIMIHGLIAIYLLSERCRRVFYPPAESIK